jgi:hypothetical protein
MISPSEVRKVISEGEILENYPEDARGHSCLLISSAGTSRILHVVCAPKDDYLAIITAYIPSEEQWSDGFKIRRKK